MRLIVEADGGSRGNPGPAAFGAVVREAETGQVLAERADYLGTATNNVAEYRGLIAGLEAAKELDPEAVVEARLDSKLVVEQMSGRWKIKHPSMQPLALAAQRVLPAGRVTYVWVPRERNRHADRLANEALDAAARGERWSPGSSRAELDAADAPDPADPAGPPPAESSTDLTMVDTWDLGLGTPTTMYLLRHGVTQSTVEKRFCGLRGADPELTPAGVEQARAAATALRSRGIAVVVSSPLRRARQTAEEVAVALGLPVEVEERIVECAFGDWDGHTLDEVQDRWPDEARTWLADLSAAPPGGESFVDVHRRVVAAREDLVTRCAGRTVLVVSHVTPIKMMLVDALAAPLPTTQRMELAPASLAELHWYPGGMASLRRFNDTAHLDRPRS